MKRFTQYSLHYTLIVLSSLSITGMLTLGSSSQPFVRHSPSSIALQQHAAPSPSNWKSYKSSTYRISLRYPNNWHKATTNGFSGIDGYEWSNGFFEVSAMEADTLQVACESQAKQRLQPFGSKPKVQSLQVQGQPACLNITFS